MKLGPNLTRPPDDPERPARRRWLPEQLFGGRMRTSTLVLIVAFFAVWWVYDVYRPEPVAKPTAPPAQVVPPGFVPDPDYTWVPRTQVQQPRNTYTPRPTTTTTLPPPPPPPTTTTTTPPPLFQLPCIPPFCTPTTSASPGPGPLPSPTPQPGPGPVPTSAPPAS